MEDLSFEPEGTELQDRDDREYWVIVPMATLDGAEQVAKKIRKKGFMGFIVQKKFDASIGKRYRMF